MNNAVRWTPEEQAILSQVRDYLQRRAGPGRRVSTSETLRWCVRRGHQVVESGRRLSERAAQKRSIDGAD